MAVQLVAAGHLIYKADFSFKIGRTIGRVSSLAEKRECSFVRYLQLEAARFPSSTIQTSSIQSLLASRDKPKARGLMGLIEPSAFPHNWAAIKLVPSPPVSSCLDQEDEKEEDAGATLRFQIPNSKLQKLNCLPDTGITGLAQIQEPPAVTCTNANTARFRSMISVVWF